MCNVSDVILFVGWVIGFVVIFFVPFPDEWKDMEAEKRMRIAINLLAFVLFIQLVAVGFSPPLP